MSSAKTSKAIGHIKFNIFLINGNNETGQTNLTTERMLAMGILSWIVLGGLAGWVASIIMKKNASMGVFENIIVGIIGAFIGGFVMNYVGGWHISGFNIESFFVALLGSVVLLAIINLINRGRVR